MGDPVLIKYIYWREWTHHEKIGWLVGDSVSQLELFLGEVE